MLVGARGDALAISQAQGRDADVRCNGQFEMLGFGLAATAESASTLRTLRTSVAERRVDRAIAAPVRMSFGGQSAGGHPARDAGAGKINP